MSRECRAINKHPLKSIIKCALTFLFIGPLLLYLHLLAMGRTPGSPSLRMKRDLMKHAKSKHGKLKTDQGKTEVFSFPDDYHAIGVLQLPYGNIAEPFEAWYSAKNKMSRIDYYGGEQIKLSLFLRFFSTAEAFLCSSYSFKFCKSCKTCTCPILAVISLNLHSSSNSLPKLKNKLSFIIQIFKYMPFQRWLLLLGSLSHGTRY